MVPRGHSYHCGVIPCQQPYIFRIPWIPAPGPIINNVCTCWILLSSSEHAHFWLFVVLLLNFSVHLIEWPYPLIDHKSRHQKVLYRVIYLSKCFHRYHFFGLIRARHLLKLVFKKAAKLLKVGLQLIWHFDSVTIGLWLVVLQDVDGMRKMSVDVSWVQKLGRKIGKRGLDHLVEEPNVVTYAFPLVKILLHVDPIVV